MFTFFNSESLWTGTDQQVFDTLRATLKDHQIPYKHKVSSRLGQWNGAGTTRGRMGSAGIPSDQMYLYEIVVYKKDLEKARYLTRSSRARTAYPS